MKMCYLSPVQDSYRKSFLRLVPLIVLLGMWAAQSALASEQMSAREREAVRHAISSIRHGKGLVFLFSPAPTGLVCEQAKVLAKEARERNGLRLTVVWLIAHDFFHFPRGTEPCSPPLVLNLINARQMSIRGAGSNDGGASMLYRYFNVDPEEFQIIILGGDGRVKVRSSHVISPDSSLK